MKDLHNHLLYGIDDGASSIEESIYLITKLYEKGYKDLVLTPHFIEDTKYQVDNIEKQKRLEELKKVLKERNISINLYLGNEVYITPNVKELIDSNKITTINNTKYILIELSMFNKLSNDIDILLELLKTGYIPILAHPERYEYYEDNIEVFRYLVSKGVLLQGDITSLINKRRKKLLEKLIKEDLIHLMSTDIHKKDSIELLEEGFKQLEKLISKEKQKELMDINIKKILENKEVNTKKNNQRNNILSFLHKKIVRSDNNE